MATFALLTVYCIINVRCGNFSALPLDIQSDVFWKLNVMDRLNVRKVDKTRDELIIAVHRADVFYVNEIKSIIESLTNKNMHYSRSFHSWNLVQIEAFVEHRRFTLPFYQALPSIFCIIKNNSRLSQRNKKILTTAVNVTHGKCQLCFKDIKIGEIVHCVNFVKAENICNFCKECWKEWISQNKTGLVLCPVCCETSETIALQTNFPFPSQPRYTESEKQTCFDRMQNRIDFRNGCLGNFVCFYWSFLSWMWCSRIQAGFHGICDYAECCLRGVVGVPLTAVVFGFAIDGLCVSACCCCDCCYVCFPEHNWRAVWMKLCSTTTRCALELP